MQTKQFHIGDVLSVLTGRVLSVHGIVGMNVLLDFLIGGELLNIQLHAKKNECKAFLLEQFPQFDTPEMQIAVGTLIEMLNAQNDQNEKDMLIQGWLCKLVSGGYGVVCEEMLEVRPLCI